MEPDTEIKVLRAALLWARNHIDCSTNASPRDEVVETLDRVLDEHDPSAADMRLFRKMFPRRKTPNARLRR